MNSDLRLADRGRLYVIGDIHGCSDLLERMIEGISRDLEGNPIDDCLTVTLGDYFDRTRFARRDRSARR